MDCPREACFSMPRYPEALHLNPDNPLEREMMIASTRVGSESRLMDYPG